MGNSQQLPGLLKASLSLGRGLPGPGCGLGALMQTRVPGARAGFRGVSAQGRWPRREQKGKAKDTRGQPRSHAGRELGHQSGAESRAQRVQVTFQK